MWSAIYNRILAKGIFMHMGQSGAPSCRLCGQSEAINSLLFDCPLAHNAHSQRLFDLYKKNLTIMQSELNKGRVNYCRPAKKLASYQPRGPGYHSQEVTCLVRAHVIDTPTIMLIDNGAINCISGNHLGYCLQLTEPAREGKILTCRPKLIFLLVSPGKQ